MDRFLLIIVRLLLFIGNGCITCLKLCLFPRKISPSLSRILIFKVGHIGDVVCAIPAMRGVREYFQNAHITLLTSTWQPNMIGAREIIGKEKFINEIIYYSPDDIKTFSGKLRLINKLRRNKHECFIEFSEESSSLKRIIRNMVFAKIIGCTYAIKPKFSNIKYFRKIQGRFIKFSNESERLLKILNENGIRRPRIEYGFNIDNYEIENINKKLFMGDIKKNEKTYVVVHMWSKFECNRWPINNFKEVIRNLTNSNVTVVLTGNEETKLLAKEVKMLDTSNIIDATAKTTIRELIVLLSMCDLLISLDTGIIHIASLVGTPAVGIYSARDLAEKWYPYGSNNVIFRKSIDCEGCMTDICPYSNKCINMVSAEEVFCAVSELIERGKQHVMSSLS